MKTKTALFSILATGLLTASTSALKTGIRGGDAPERVLQEEGPSKCLDPTNNSYKCIFDTNTNLSLRFCGLKNSDVALLEPCFQSFGPANIKSLAIHTDYITEVPDGVFSSLTSLGMLTFVGGDILDIPEGLCTGLTSMTSVTLGGFRNAYADFTSLPEGILQGLPSLEKVFLTRNKLTSIPRGIFANLTGVTKLALSRNRLTTLPAGLFDDMPNLEQLFFNDMADLQCIPSFPADVVVFPPGSGGGTCECTEGLTDCDTGSTCSPGALGYTCSEPAPTPTTQPVAAPTQPVSAPTQPVAAPTPADDDDYSGDDGDDGDDDSSGTSGTSGSS